MDISRHASIRSRQRGFQQMDLFLIENFGAPVKKKGNLIEYRVTQKSSKQIIQALDRICHKAILVDEINGEIVTAYNLYNL